MIEEVGVVKSIEGERIIVQTQMKNACKACSQKAACGTGVIARAVANKTSDFVFSSSNTASLGQESGQVQSIADEKGMPFSPGQQVRLGIQEESLLTASALMYVVPLIGLMLSALVGQFLLPMIGLHGEGWVIALTALGVFVTFKWVKLWTRKQCKHQFEPVLLGTLLDKKPEIVSEESQ